MKSVQKSQTGVYPLQLMEKAARLQSSPQLSGSSSLSKDKKDNDLVTMFALSEIHLTENGYLW